MFNEVILAFLGSTFVVSGAAIYFLLNLEKLESALAVIYRFGSILFPTRIIRNSSTAMDIQSKVNSFCEEIEKKAPGIMPAALKVQFVNDDDIRAFESSDGKTIILRMNYDRDKNKLLAGASYLYIKRGFLIRPKLYLGQLEKSSIDLCVTKGLLRNTRAISTFIEEYLEPQIVESPNLKDLCHKIDSIDESGFFYEVFVRVLLRISNQLYPTMSDNMIYKEIGDFIDFLYAIATKQPQQKVPLSFNGTYIKVAIILVKEEETFAKHGEEAYVNRYIMAMEDGIEIIFLKGRGEEAIDLIRSIVSTLGRRKLIEYGKDIIRPLKMGTGGYKRAMYVYSLPDKNALEYEAVKSQEDLHKLLLACVPGIEENRVEIISLARVKGVLSKILVKATSPGSSAIGLCLGKDGCNLKALGERLDTESIEFIEYTDDMRQLIKDAVFGRSNFGPDVVSAVSNIDGINTYEVIVESEMALSHVLSADAMNKRMVDKLLKIHTHYSTQEKPKKEQQKNRVGANRGQNYLRRRRSKRPPN